MKPEATQPSRKPENVLVTGGGGFLGGAIVRRLVARGDRVRSFSRGTYPNLEEMGIAQIRGDLADKNALSRALRGIDLVFHAAAKTGVWGPYDAYFKTNVTGTLNVINACRENDIQRLVYTGSPSVVFNGRDMEGVDETVPYPEAYTAHYPKTKALAEQAVIRAASESLRTIVLRPHLIWGPGDTSLVPRILARAKRLKRVGSGENLVDTVFIDNAAEAHIQAADRLAQNPRLSGRCYFITQDEPIPLWEMINRILAAGGLPPVKGSIAPEAARLLGSVLERFYALFRISAEPPMTRFVAEELATAHWFDISAAKRDLGYKPRVSTAEGLKRLERWLREDPGSGAGDLETDT